MTCNAPAKINIFLKITGTRDGYHTLRSRFVRYEALYDTLTFVAKEEPRAGFEMHSDPPLPPDNTIIRAYTLLKERVPHIATFFTDHALRLTKRIPQGAGLGGGSSNAASFLLFANRTCNAGLPVKALAAIGERIGADVPFFVYGYPGANVEGIGEIVEPFDDELPTLELLTPNLHCDTKAVYRAYRRDFLHSADKQAGRHWEKLTSRQLMQELRPLEANDLLAPALALYPPLKRYAQPGWFFSGSGSTFFRLKACN